MNRKCYIWNLCGPAETTLQSLFHRVDSSSDIESIPLGKPLPNYYCIFQNDSAQPVTVNQESEVLMSGVGIFAGYLGRDDLTAKSLTEINGEVFYRTGDIVRMDNNGLLHYINRKDFQIKLHGQRIELGEIERCLLNTSISACVVMKWGDDHLIAYVQKTDDIDEKQLRQHCQSHLPSHMIPSIFIILDKLPLNTNGKVDRKQLPPPHFSSTHLTDHVELLQPTNNTEVIVHDIWCDVFKQNQISIDTNIFTIGGHSLLLIQLLYRYKTEFHLETNTLSINDLFQQSTIVSHAQLIHQNMNITQNIDHCHWSSLHLTQGKKQFVISITNYVLFLSF